MKHLFIIVVIVIAVALPAVVYAAGTTNATVTVYDQDGHAIEIPVPNSVGALAEKYGGWIACLTTIAGLILRFTPKAEPGTWKAFFVWALKFVKFSTPEKHTDIAPIEDKLIASPRTNVDIGRPGVGIGATEIVNRPQT